MVYLLGTLIAEGGPPKIRRICKNGLDNILYFYPSDDTCSKFQNYYIWGRDGDGNPYQLLDSLSTKSASQYTHIGANPAGNPKSWNYFIIYKDSCTPPLTQFSDSMNVDETPPDAVFLDSVSVDLNSQKIVLGWTSNKNSDFYRYIVFRDSLGWNVEISPAELRDTTLTDTYINPANKAVKYDITATDSCGITQVFGSNPHVTIHLNPPAIDSCINKLLLTWSHYIGWPSVRSYHIIVNKDLGGYTTLDSVNGIFNTYTMDIQSGSSYSIFVRAFHGTKENTGSASNLVSASTRLRVDPANTYLANVSAIDPDLPELELTTLMQSGEEYSAIIPAVSTPAQFPAFTNQPAQSIVANPMYSYYTAPNTAVLHLFKIKGVNLCGQVTHESNISPNIVLKATGNGAYNSLVWNAFTGWDNGVEMYKIYRGTNSDNPTLVFELINTLLGADTLYEDHEIPDIVGNRGTCYYIEAIQNSGSPHGIKAVSKSFVSCVFGELLVFVPNAFSPLGVNKIFRPEGSFIDYDKSSIEIYDRWGTLIYNKTGIVQGWDGNRNNGEFSGQGVYFYQLKIVSTNGISQTKKGTVTLLN